MDGESNDGGASQRWTCEACGCNTNAESDRSCSICGTSNGSSLLRRAGYAARSGIFARSFAARRGIMNDEIGMERDDLWERVIDDVDMAGEDDEEEQAIAALAMEVAGVSGGRDSNRQRFMEAARSFAMASRETQRPDPDELLHAANENGFLYQPKWVNPSQIGGRMRTGNGIEVGEGGNQNVAHLPVGAGEGRALRALESFPRSAPFASFNLASPNDSSSERRPRRAFGFRVAFEHPTKEAGKNLGGCYLIGVTTTSFAAFGERNGLQQSPFFWGIEDSGNKYEGSRHSNNVRGSRRAQANYGTELAASEATRNADNALFTSRDVVTCVIDFESRTLTFWRDDELIGTVVSNLPRGGNLYPIVVPFNAGTTVAITGIGGNPLPLLRAFATDWKQAQKEKDIQKRGKLKSQRSLLIQDGLLTEELVLELRTVYSWYAKSQDFELQDDDMHLTRVEASRLWYRCGMKLSSLETLLQEKSPPSNVLRVNDFLNLVQRVIREEDESMSKGKSQDRSSESSCEVGDKVELVEGYERYGDASNGPLHPGDRGNVVEIQDGPNRERSSIRVLHNGRRWWYQPHALVPERSGLTESAGVWFIRTILRAHGYDHSTLQSLKGKPVTTTSWQVGDIVVPRKMAAESKSNTGASVSSQYTMDSCVGRIVAESASTSSSLTVRGRDSGTVLVEYVDKSFAEATGVQTGALLQDSGSALETRRVRISRLVHSSTFHGTTAVKRGRAKESASPEPMHVNYEESDTSLDLTVSDKVVSDLKKMRRLDVSAIESVTKECKKNYAALSSLFAAGLPDVVMAAVDSALKMLGKSEEGDEKFSEAISALGRLATVIVEQLFSDARGNLSNSSDNAESQPIVDGSSPGEEKSSQDDEEMQDLPRLSRRNDELDARSQSLSDAALMQEAGDTGRLSSLQQRRSMLLALMSRARRNSAGSSMNDILNREMHGSARDAADVALNRIMPSLGGPFRQDPAAALLFGPPGDFLSGGSWDDPTSDAEDERPRPENFTHRSPSNNTRRSLRSSPPSGAPQEVECPFLESLLRGRTAMQLAQASEGKPPGTVQSASLRALVSNGLLGNNLTWTKTVLDIQSKRLSSKPSQSVSTPLQTAADEDGTPLLLLAISLGCSSSILRYLITMGAQVGEKEIKEAAATDQSEALSTLLEYAVYSEGLIDHDQCSQQIARVIHEASSRQEKQMENMKRDSRTLMVTLLRKLVQLGLASRHQNGTTDVCSRAIAGTLVGDVLLRALHQRQQNSASTSQQEERKRAYDSSDANRGRHAVEGAYAAVSTTSPGLLCVFPKDIMRESLFEEIEHVTSFFLLVEDYLCCKDINAGAIGLTLLSTLMENFPFLSQSGEIERYGFSELVSSHDAFASNRLAEIASSVSALACADEAPAAEVRATSGVVLCPKDHPATLHVTRHSSFRCDLCGKGVDCGRVMHGCRECDWDACERCTDNGEGGIVKWNHIRALAAECQRLLSPNIESADGDAEIKNGQAEKVLERLAAIDNSSEINNLSIRLLQRDSGSIKQLSSFLQVQGRMTVHQFLTVIMPALHASLLGRESENDRLKVSPTGSSRRTKKPRVVGSSSRDTEESFHTHPNDDRFAFCKVVVKHLIKEVGESEETTRSQEYQPMDSEKSRRDSSDEEDGSDDGLEDDEDDEDDIDSGTSKVGSVSKMPELLRRIHQILSLYENVATAPQPYRKPQSSEDKSGDLQSLTKPLKIRLLPSVSRKRPNTSSLRGCSMDICAEPLVSVADLESHVLRTCSLAHPKYLAFCRSLAVDKAIVIERPPAVHLQSETKHQWQVARIVAFEEEAGCHRVQYASGLKGRHMSYDTVLELRCNNMTDVERLQFDSNETRLMLTAREYNIVFREVHADDVDSKSPFDMERLLTDEIVADHDMSQLPKEPAVGTRVESNCASSQWQAFTVMKAETVGGSPGQREGMSVVLVSDSGEVHCGVRSNQIRGLDVDEGSGDDGGPDREASRARDSRGQISRAFPFLTVRRQISENHRSESSESSRSLQKIGVLKRSWSALAPIESMCPIELNLSAGPAPSLTKRPSCIGGIVWRCSLGKKEVDIFAERAVVELPPRVRVKFSSSTSHKALDVVSPDDTTLISLLWQLHRRGERQSFSDQSHSLYYSVFFESRKSFDQDDNFAVPFAAARKKADWKEMLSGYDVAAVATLKSTAVGILADQQELEKSVSWPHHENRSRKLTHLTSYSSDDEGTYRGLCEGLDEICVQCLEIIRLLSEVSDNPSEPQDKKLSTIFENAGLSKKLTEQLEDPLVVVGGAVPEWCFVASSFAPRAFSYESRQLLLKRAAFGVSRSAFRQQESKVNVGSLRQRMASLRARAVELVGEAFSGGAEDPTALQLQADELYGMEEALALRVKAAFRAERWEEHSLQVAKAVVHRDLLISDAASVMNQYAEDDRICRRRLEVRFDGESGFDAASGDEAGVTRGFYADVAEALLSCDVVAGVNYCAPVCPDASTPLDRVMPASLKSQGLPCRVPLWIPDVDASGQVIIPTPRADPQSGLGVFPRPLSSQHPQIGDVLVQFQFIGRLFASAMRDGFMFPLPLSSALLKLVQYGHDISNETGVNGSGQATNRDILLTVNDLPRPGFLGGEVYAVHVHICQALDRLDELDPPLKRSELERRCKEIAADKDFARVALGKTYDCSFEDYFLDRTFVDPLDPTQGLEAAPLCPNGHRKPVTIHNIREWVSLAKDFILHDGVIAQALAFRGGVDDFFSADNLRLFTPEELQRDVCGVGDNVDTWDELAIRKLFKLDGGKGAAEALVAVAAIGGEGGAALSRRFGPSSPTIGFVVKALLEATPKMRRQFLSFVTSVPIVTPGQIEVVPVVSPSGDFTPMSDPGCLPRANTCARRLYLPKFESYESFSQVIWAVVGEESKFKGFYEWRGN